MLSTCQNATLKLQHRCKTITIAILDVLHNKLLLILSWHLTLEASLVSQRSTSSSTHDQL